MRLFSTHTSIYDVISHIKPFATDLSNFDAYDIREGMISPSQCRAARGLLDWTQADLARAAAVGIVTVRQFEAGGSEPRAATLTVIRQALEAAGVELIPSNGGGAGVRMRERAPE